MEKNRIHRYQTAHAMAEDIQRHLNHEPVLAGQPSKVYRLKKFIRKHRPQIIWSVTVAILLAAVVVLAVLWAQKSSREKQEKLDKEIAILSKARDFRNKGHFVQAQTEVEKILNSENVGPDARLLHARIIWDLEGPDRAEEEAKKLLQEKREIAGAAYAFLVRIYLKKDPNDPKKKEEYEQIANDYQQKAERLSPTNAEAYFNRALMADIVEETLEHLNDALELKSRNYDFRRARALAYYALRRYHKMQRDVEVMISLRERDPLGHSLMAIALRETGEFQEALEYHDKAIGLSDTDPELYSQRYETYLRMGKYQRALKDIQRCVVLEPKQPIYHFDVFNTLVSLGEYQAAREKHRAIIDTDPTQLPAFEAWANRHVFQVLGAREPFELPADIASDEAFSAMQKAVDYYHRLEDKAERLVPGVYGQSSWSPKEENELAYGLSDLYTRQYKMLELGPLAVPGSSGIEIRDLDTGKTRLLVSFGKDPAWSPDGKYIAFVREPHHMREYKEEVWIISAAGEELRRLATGAWPMWATDPNQLFFHSRVDKMLYSIRIDEPTAKPEPEIECPGKFPWVSPDKKHVAYAEDNKLRIVKLPFGPAETWWTAPLPSSGMLVRWSPDGNELSVAGLTDSDLGLWIFDVEDKEAWKIFDPPAISGIWSPDMSQMVIEIKIPFEENWLVTLEPNVPVYKSIASALTKEEYLRERKEYYLGLVKDDPENTKIYIQKLASVGLSQYDLSAFVDAFMTFTEVDNLHRNLTGESRPVDLKFIAMALHNLGRKREAEAALGRLRRLFESGKYPREEHHLIQVEKLFAGENSKFYLLWGYIEAGQLEEGSQLVEELRLTSPGPGTKSATKVLARAYYNRGKKAKHRGAGYGETIADYELAVRLEPNFARPFSDLAWLQAACPAEEFRDFDKAVENATKACELTNWKDHHFVGALAAVCAEVDDFAAAVKRQKEAIDLLTASERPVWLANYEMRLKLYQSDKKYDKGSLWSFSTGHMVALWKLDEKSGRIAVDSSGNNCAGTLTGNPQWQPSGGKLSGALEFDGDGDYIRIGNEAIFDFANEITVAAWVNITEVPEIWTAIVTKGNSAWRLSTYRNEKKFHFNVTGYSRVYSHVHGEKEVGKGEWHHVCGTYDGAYVRLYIDGVEDPASRRDEASYSGRITGNDFDVCIGENSEKSERYWHGLIDDVRIYSYALSQQEIKAIFSGEESNSVKD
jgi:tetratricopeptide (TPR) repeat protein